MPKAPKNKVAASSAEEVKTPSPAQIAASVTPDNSWKKIQNQYVFIQEPQTTKARNTGNILASQEQVSYTIFPVADNPEETVYWGGINGFFFSVVIGVEVRLPKGIADHITKSRIANSRLARSLRVVNPFTGQPVNVNLEGASSETRARLGIF